MSREDVLQCLKQLKEFNAIESKRNLTLAEKIDRDNLVYLLSELFNDKKVD